MAVITPTGMTLLWVYRSHHPTRHHFRTSIGLGKSSNARGRSSQVLTSMTRYRPHSLIPGHVLHISSVHMYRQKLHVLSLLIVGHSQPAPLACFLSYD